MNQPAEQHDGQKLTEAIRQYLDSEEARNQATAIRARFARKTLLSAEHRSELASTIEPDSRPVILFEMGTDHGGRP